MTSTRETACTSLHNAPRTARPPPATAATQTGASCALSRYRNIADPATPPKSALIGICADTCVIDDVGWELNELLLDVGAPDDPRRAVVSNEQIQDVRWRERITTFPLYRDQTLDSLSSDRE